MKRYLHRHSGVTRFNHWIMVILFGLAGFSGLALFHPNLFPLTGIFGGPQWTRIVHPYFGICVFIAFLFMLGRTYVTRTFTHEQAVHAVVTSYYWHFVDAIWIILFGVIYILR